MIKFGTFQVKFQESREVKSSQVLAKSVSQIRSQSQKFFVQLTQTEDVGLPDDVTSQNFFAETEEDEINISDHPESLPETESEVSLDVTSEDVCATGLYSQNIFLNVKPAQLLSQECLLDTSESSSESTELPRKRKSQKQERDDCSTPELDTTIRITVTPDKDIDVNIKQEFRFPTPNNVRKSIKSEVAKLKLSPKEEPIELFEDTQPIFFGGLKTRFNTRKQAQLKPKTISLSQFDETQCLVSPMKKIKPSFSFETQPVMMHISEKVPSSNKTVNRILISSDEESEKENTNNVTPIPPKSDSDHLTQLTDSPFEVDNTTPVVMPRLPTETEDIRALLKVANDSQSQDDPSLVDFDPCFEVKPEATQNFSPKPKKSGKLQKRKSRILKFAAYSSDSD